MSAPRVPLRSFDPREAAGFEAFASARIAGERLRLRYEVRAASAKDFSRLSLPGRGPGGRADRLWEGTCFEAFISDGDATEAYAELNGAPDGRWNLYRFDAYRTGMGPLELSSAPRIILDERSSASAIIEWEFPRPFRELGPSVGLTAVLVIDERPTYWAVAHAGERPDFHRRASFVYPLSKQTSGK